MNFHNIVETYPHGYQSEQSAEKRSSRARSNSSSESTTSTTSNNLDRGSPRVDLSITSTTPFGMDEKHPTGSVQQDPHQQQQRQAYSVHFMAATLTKSPTESCRKNSTGDVSNIPSNQRRTADSVSISINDSSSPQSPLRSSNADVRRAKTMFDDVSKAKRDDIHHKRRESIASK